MYLKRLEMQGFKSFADKTVLEFIPGITTVIGPNGSGKSNISDAIRWVLGEQSMKSLRGAKSEDIIFAGTQNRKSLGFAEASLVFDNSDNKLPVEYNEVVITRKIYRSGESGYFINKTPCRLKDVLELFMDTGIGKDGYSIIGQGKIDEILSNKSEDRRHIFEEAAGVVKYRTRKIETEKKLEHTKLNLLRINDILSEIETTIEPLKHQSEKAKKFLDLREELKSIEIGLFIFNINSYKEKLEKIIIDENILKEDNDIATSKLEEISNLKIMLKEEIDNITNEIEKMQSIGFESQNEKERINSEIVISKERIQNNNENFERFNKEIEEISVRNNELENEKQNKLEKKNSLFNNKEKFQKELQEKEQELKQILEKMSTKELEIEDKKKKVEANTELKYEKSSLVSSIEANFANLEKRKIQIKHEIDMSISEIDNNKTSKEDLQKEFYNIEKQKNEIEKRISNIIEKRNETELNIKKYETKINDKLSEFRIKESRCKFLEETEKEKEGYTRTVKSLLISCENDKTLNSGVHGVLANLINTSKEYETAIEMVLGPILQNIVTQTEEDAKKLVEFLRKNNLGRASFLPISAITGKKIEKYNTKGISGVIGVASDLVKTDKKYEEIILSLLGRTIVVENMDSAIALAKLNNYSFRILTKDGDIINPSGAITGGSVQNKTVNILGRAKEIEEIKNYLINLKKEIENLEKEKNEYLNNSEDVFDEVDALEKNMKEIEIVYATDKQKILAIEENIVKVENRLNKLKNEQLEIEEQKNIDNENKTKYEKEIQDLLNENKDLNIEIEQFSNLNKDNQRYIDDLNLDVTNLKISVSSFDESETSIDEIIDRINLDINNNLQSIENKNHQKEEIIKINKELEEKIKEYNNQITVIEKSVENSGTKVVELKNERVNKNEKLNNTEKEFTSQIEVIDGLKEQLVKIDVKKVKLEQDIEDVVNKLWEEYELTPNNVENYKKPDNVQETTKAVSSIRNKIKDLGSINIESIEEYKQTKQRYDFMCEQRLDLEDGITKLRKIITDMTNVMKEQFTEKFNIINKNFGEVFKELFGGGKAELILTDKENILECGIEITVQPPGKKLQNMTLLSGGEKAFTAIALLFAILKINPAPFCVLDEIEAALDDVNVFRYADYLKKFTNKTQFLAITHRKGTMEAADTVYGVTMEENGISKLLSMKLK